MQTKHFIYLGIFIGSSLGGWLGSLLDHGNLFGLWAILFSLIGAFAGIWAGYRMGNL